MMLVEAARAAFESGEAESFADRRSRRSADRWAAGGVGTVATALPLVLLLPGPTSCERDSISHYYYAQLWGDVFVMALAFIGSFLIMFRGENWKHNLLTTAAGVAALLVALLPTAGPGCEREEFGGRFFAQVVGHDASTGTIGGVRVPKGSRDHFVAFEGVEKLHYAAAAVLFGFLAFYVLVVLTGRKDWHRGADGEPWGRPKVLRNRLYITSGIVMLAAMAALGWRWLSGGEGVDWWNRRNLTFWFEALVLWGFALAWLTKSRFFGLMLRDADEDKPNRLATS